MPTIQRLIEINDSLFATKSCTAQRDKTIGTKGMQRRSIKHAIEEQDSRRLGTCRDPLGPGYEPYQTTLVDATGYGLKF
jgi:hypothetical protein